jgi:ADP-ribosylglycohydrolase
VTIFDKRRGRMKENGKSVVLASLVADSLALGAHWIYDTQQIADRFGRVESLLKPPADSFHITKNKGDFTHYGDQALVLLESVAENKGFDLFDFSARWQKLLEGYQGYIDQATRLTLEQYDLGKDAETAGSPSNDLAGASRIAPLVYCYRNDLERLIQAARAQTKMTHTDPATVDSAEFFARVCWHVLNGVAPAEAIKRVSQDNFQEGPIPAWVRSGLDSKGQDSVDVIGGFGRSCHTPDAFPGVVHLLARYEDDLKEALVQSVMAGGDSAARGMMVGMVLGAHLGTGAIPEDWLNDLNQKNQIFKLIEQIP